MLAPVLFPGESIEDRKLFVTICHQAGALECIKATSNTAAYKGDARLAKGCVFYAAGELAVFPKDTYIDPGNRFSVQYAKVAEPHCVRATLPRNFHDRLVYAIKASYMLSVKEKLALLALIGEKG